MVNLVVVAGVFVAVLLVTIGGMAVAFGGSSSAVSTGRRGGDADGDEDDAEDAEEDDGTEIDPMAVPDTYRR